MSNISCDACNNLREYAPEFVQNGVNENVCASLMNNTGLNPGLTVLHDNCDDLHDVNDCLIGRMTDELEAYDVCDWKDFMQKQNSNLYETLKAIICSTCGLWKKLCESLASMLALIRGNGGTVHKMTPTALMGQKFSGYFFGGSKPQTPATPVPAVIADIREGVTCDASKRLGVFRIEIVSQEDRPAGQVLHWDIDSPLTQLDVLATINKSDLVPKYLTEDEYNRIGTGTGSYPLGEILVGTKLSMLYARLRGYVTFEGVVWNEDLLQEYGPNVLVLEFIGSVGGDVQGSGAYLVQQRLFISYDA